MPNSVFRRIVLGLLFLAVLLVMGCMRETQGAAKSSGSSEKTDEGGTATIVAHRGASGYLPEHTLPAYALAYSMGADFIESDLVMTKDGELVVLHDIHLESTTDVEQLFPDRKRDDGKWYAADLSLAEVKSLSVHERANELGKAVFPKRFRVDSKGFRVPTFREVIELVQELNRESGCDVGLYPETKGPEFHDEEGLPLEERLLEILTEYGYSDASSNVIVQSFSAANLIEMREKHKTQLRLVLLLDEGEEQAEFLTAEGLDRVALYANGIGPSKRLIEDKDGQPVNGAALVGLAHERGLVVHPYTFRADVPQSTPFEEEVARFVNEYGVDGLFSDHPDRALLAVGGQARTSLSCR